MYADIVLLSTTSYGLQSKLKYVDKFCSDWCLNINTNKTKILVFNKQGRLINEKFTLQQVELECVQHYKYLGLIFSASGVFSHARQELYKKSLKGYYKLCKDVIRSHPKITTSLHLFDHMIKPISLYSSEIWGTFNLKSSKFGNDVLLDRIYSDLEPDKLHMKITKFILGVNRKSSNFAVLSELGRFPIYISIVKDLLNYYFRIENMPEDSLLYKALQTSKDLDDKNHNSWYSSVRHLCKIIDLPSNFINFSKYKFRKCLLNCLKVSYVKSWENAYSQNSQGKLRTYCQFKTSFCKENYLNILKNFDLRKAITKFRISSHRLKIETGRYSKLEVHQRICDKCDLNKVEDELHFLIECPVYSKDRDLLFDLIFKECKIFYSLDMVNKIWLLNCESINILKQLGYFLSKHLP